MATLDQRIISLAQLVGADIKKLNLDVGDKAALTTTAKANLVAAINEIKSAQAAATGINDSTSGTASTYSSSKVEALIAALKDEIMGGTPAAAYDTLKEIADYIESDKTSASAMTVAINKRVRYDAAQNLSAAQQLTACNNIGVGNPDTDFVASYNAAKA